MAECSGDAREHWSPSVATARRWTCCLVTSAQWARWAWRSRRRVTVNTALATASLLLSANAWPQQAPPWFELEAESPVGSPSLEVVFDDEPIFQTPGATRNRRGAATLGARLPWFGSAMGPGCEQPWHLVGAFAWICGDRVRQSDWPFEIAGRMPHFADGLPFKYYFVGIDGSFGYASLASADEGAPQSQFEPDFSVAVVRLEPKASTGELYALTSHGSWLPARDLRPANPSDFEGVVFAPKQTEAAWTFSETPVSSSPGAKPHRTLPPLRHIVFGEELTQRGRAYLRLADGGYVERKNVRLARARSTPEGLLPNERWLDIDIDQQTLVAYEGNRAVFGTLVSSGRGSDGSAEATPKGEFRIWVKLLSTDMTNLERDEAQHYYAIEDVPWVMFFQAGYGLHGAFWHRSFGNRRSHGCVNLSPRDAQRLFAWTSPLLPSGWRAALPTAYDLGTRVVVH